MFEIFKVCFHFITRLADFDTVANSVFMPITCYDEMGLVKFRHSYQLKAIFDQSYNFIDENVQRSGRNKRS